MGDAFSLEWANARRQSEELRNYESAASGEKPLPPEPTYKPYYRHSSSGESTIGLIPGHSPSYSESIKRMSTSTFSTSHGVGSTEEESMSDRDRAVLRVLDLVEEMKREPEWYGTAYDLLSRNCNHFTSEFCYRLTGRRAPGWISTYNKLF
jgi:hypothetical protein